MSKLKAIKPKEAKQSKAKIVVFGEAGVGKTYTSMDFPNCYYIDAEAGGNRKQYMQKLEGSGGVYLGVEQGSQDFKEVIEQVKALATEKHPYKTLIIDSISKLFNNEIAKEIDNFEKQKRDLSKTFGAEKKPAINLTKKLIQWLDKLDMNVIIIAHSKAKYENGEQIGSTADAWDKLEYELDLCLEIKRIGKSTRKAYVKKSRLEGFLDASNFEWSYKEFAERYGKDIIEGDVESIELATKEQLTELERLLKLIVIEDSEKDKWLKKAGCDSFEEMEASKLDACINYLNQKIKGE